MDGGSGAHVRQDCGELPGQFSPGRGGDPFQGPGRTVPGADGQREQLRHGGELAEDPRAAAIDLAGQQVVPEEEGHHGQGPHEHDADDRIQGTVDRERHASGHPQRGSSGRGDELLGPVVLDGEAGSRGIEFALERLVAEVEPSQLPYASRQHRLHDPAQGAPRGHDLLLVQQ
ncbi:hypothetical protein ACFFX0_29240 [Citricoccus parietis]|uniref:Uncharacterized protein n=1 Tax=Citricoccus parietis TaxID=592307 RepID=A0ABV5G7W1_9MICC